MQEHSNNNSLHFVYPLRNQMRTHNFMLAYRGAFSQEITKALLTTTEKKLTLEGTEASIKKKVFYVMVECLQNICKHTETKDEPAALFMIGGMEKEYVIYSGNVIANDKTQGLKNKLVAINSMGKEELKELYKSLMTAPELSESGGAGLGLIDIAKKSGNKFDFEFQSINTASTFFSLKTAITPLSLQQEEDAENLLPPREHTVPFVHEFYNLMKEHHLIMIYEGDFNQDIAKIVLSMTEKKFDAEGIDLAIKKKVFNVMVESLQNVCKHKASDDLDGHSTHSIFMIGNNDNNEVTVLSGNVLPVESIIPLKSRIDQINALDKDGLKQLYKEVRTTSTISEVGGAGLGFIDMARKSGNKLNYHFKKINEQLYFFTLLATVSKKEEEINIKS